MNNLGKTKIFKGVQVSPGIAIGRVKIFLPGRFDAPKRHILNSEVEAEKERFKDAVSQVEAGLKALLNDIPQELKEHAAIFTAHLMMLRDNMIYDETLRIIETQKINAEWALSKVLDKIKNAFCKIKDDFIRERFSDVEGVIKRVYIGLHGIGKDDEKPLSTPSIIVANDLSPSDTIQFNPNIILGFVTEKGSRTSHTAIVARSLGIPAIVGVKGILKEVTDGDTIIVDGLCGEVLTTEDKVIIESYKEKQRDFRQYSSDIINTSHLPAITSDGIKVTIKANIEMVEETPTVLSYGAEGIGLLRTEFLYLSKKGLPEEEELFDTYIKIVKGVYPNPVTIRTLDIGGDKFVSSMPFCEEMNPALGLRAIRLCLKEPGLFKTQLRAILRASAYGNVRILFPLISGKTEIVKAKQAIDEVKEELLTQGMPFDEAIKIGIMIEVPTAVMMADALAKEVDFFSIGTNDLIQYSLAIDRVNERVAHLYEPLHPAIIRMLKQVIKAGHKADIEVGVCGEMAGEPIYIPVLIGLEVDELSMNAIMVPRIKKMIRGVSQSLCKGLVDDILQETTAISIRKRLIEFLRDNCPDEFSPEKGLYCELSTRVLM